MQPFSRFFAQVYFFHRHGACRRIVAVFLLAVSAGGALSAPANSTGERYDFDRSRFGGGPDGIWSELTPFERDTLNNSARIRRGEPDALLALFLIASGDVRDYATYRHYRDRIDHWLKSLAPRLKKLKDEKERGRTLYRAMHEEFFPPQQAADELATGYNFDQSKLSEIFTTRQFNCISSSLLFIIAAHKLGFTTKGVLLPSHSFVELVLGDGERVEVETTARNGFDLVHDAAFYEPRRSQWFAERELEPLTYAQYQARDIIDPYELGLYNMWSQHTNPARMAYRDRLRLAEIRALFLPGDITVQKTRLSFYNQEFNYLHDREDFATLERMFKHIAPYLQSLGDHPSADAELRNLLAWVHSQRALALINSGKTIEGIALVRELLQNLEAGLSDYGRIQNNLYLLLANFLQDRSDEEDFGDAHSAVAGFEGRCLANSACANGLAGLYANWAKHYWQQREWGQAIEVYHQYLGLDRASRYAETFRTNVQKAHINWANQVLLDEDWQAASEILERCKAQLQHADQCEQRLQMIKEQVHLGNL